MRQYVDPPGNALQDIGVAKPPGWLTRAFSLIERDDLTVNLDQLTTLQKVLLSALCHNTPHRRTKSFRRLGALWSVIG